VHFKKCFSNKEEKMSLLDNLFVNLRVISKIPENGRISTTGAGQIKIEDTKTLNGWLSTGRRRLTGDSRDEAVKVLMQIINDVGELSDNIIDSLKTGAAANNNNLGVLNENTKKCHQLQKLSIMLKNSKKGIVNLHHTYSDDANVTARLDEVMDKIDQQHNTILEVLEHMKSNGVMTHHKQEEPQHQHHQQHQPAPFLPQIQKAIAAEPVRSNATQDSDDSDDDQVNLNF
jgi:hypothetical protein